MIRVIRHHAPAGVYPLLLSEILLICAAFYLAAWLLYPPDPAMFFLYEGGIERMLPVLVSLVGALYFFDLYSDIAVRSRLGLFQQLCQVVGVTLLIQSVIAYAFRNYILPHVLMLYGSLFTLVVAFVWRTLYSSVLLQAVGRERILFLGCNETVRDITREIASDPSSGYEVIGCLSEEEAEPAVDGAPALGGLTQLRAVVAERTPRRIVVGLPERRDHMPVRDLLDLRFAGCRIEEASITYETVYKRVCSRELSPARAVFQKEFMPPASALSRFQAFDQALAVALVVALSPVLLLTALALRARHGGSILARQTRVGKDGRLFEVFRFAENRESDSFYHRHRLAALPGLLNVLRGEMALVGPRPASPEYAQVLSDELPLYDYRHGVRPGMTGWAQINSSPVQSANSARELEYDLYYIKHMSLGLNGYILLNTLKNRVLRVESSGA